VVKYILKRCLQALPVLFGATFLVYGLVFLQPGDPIRALCGQHCPNEAGLDIIRARYNLDKPFILQYLLYMKNLLLGDFGTTFSGRSVSDIIATSMPNTIHLGLIAIAFEIILGVGIGIIVGIRRGSFFDSSILVITLILISIPTFVLGFVCQLVFGMNLGIVPPTVGSSTDFEHMYMPALILATGSIASICRLTRNSIQDNSYADHVRTSYAKGLPRYQVTLRHIFRNSMIPVVTYIGADLGALMGGAVLTETIFNIQGIGNQLYAAIQRGEGTTVVSIITLFVIIFVVTNIVVDILYAVLDPRIRYGK
jgi:oligopeptide transport system permease protein